MSSKNFVIMGLPKSGKTTFLAALWHLIEACEVETSLRLAQLRGDITYLNTISKAWREFNPVPRTSMQSEPTIEIVVADASSGETALLAFPDLSGEGFEQQVEQRSCTREYLERCDVCDGLILFLTANRSHDDLTLYDIHDAMGPPGEQDVANQVPWTPKAIPEQVRLVDMLQFLTRMPFRRAKRRLAVVISAWDLVSPAQRDPAAWLARELPLVDQFLKTNGRWFEVSAYGVSAQGFDLESGDKDAAARLGTSARVIVDGPNAGPHDLTAPLKWLMMA